MVDIQLTVMNTFMRRTIRLCSTVVDSAMTVQQVVSFTQCMFIQTKHSPQLFSIKRRHLTVASLGINHSACQALLVHLTLEDLLFNAACCKQSVDVCVMALAVTPHPRHCLQCINNNMPEIPLVEIPLVQ